MSGAPSAQGVPKETIPICSPLATKGPPESPWNKNAINNKNRYYIQNK